MLLGCGVGRRLSAVKHAASGTPRHASESHHRPRSLAHVQEQRSSRTSRAFPFPITLAIAGRSGHVWTRGKGHRSRHARGQTYLSFQPWSVSQSLTFSNRVKGVQPTISRIA